jgi:predicted transport protein
MALTYVKPERLWLKSQTAYDEKWVQNLIAGDPRILGLGDLVLKDYERSQPRGGRLDLLLQDLNTKRRYEVELQLGATDETHIIRTIEYWDIERRRYPQYEHCAVLVAEDITSRFLNVISLFNGLAPFIAIQMQAVTLEDRVTLIFTKVMDEFSRGLVDDDEDGKIVVADRQYWESVSPKETVALSDDILQIAREIDPSLNPNYNKAYIGILRGNRPFNFVTMRPRKKHIVLELKIPQSDEVSASIDEESFDVMEYDQRWGNCRLQLDKEDIESKRIPLKDLIQKAYERKLL